LNSFKRELVLLATEGERQRNNANMPRIFRHAAFDPENQGDRQRASREAFSESVNGQ
jgi:hypothetical protein